MNRGRPTIGYMVRLATCAGVLALLAGAPALAQSGSEAPRAERQRSEPGALMGERAYRRFEAITELYGAERYAEALQAAEAYLRAGLNDYERAMGEQLAGHVLIALDRLEEAVPRLETALRLDALPNAAHFGLMRSLAQLHAALEHWPAVLETMDEYLRYHPEPAPEDRIVVAQAHAQLGQFRAALPWVQAAIESAGPKAVESWYQLELAIHLELGDHRAARHLLRAMVARWPGRLRYWEMLAGVHQELGEDKDALAALMAAYHGRLITEQSKLLNLARLSLYVDLPYQAGQILSRSMAAGQVQRNEANLRLLLQAWMAAREFERAVEVIDRLAPMAGDGELFLKKARLMMEQNDWAGTVAAARQALELGQLRSPGAAWLLMGIAWMELDELNEARHALQRAQEHDDDSRRQAREWQRFVDERLRVAELRDAR